ncbi:winged helix-turn-helix transcriptional regulator [Candidatus Pacearchaeota archaeon]|nr:winged helix-turn-helix transcriptional regulator [Candidatus Pacearchaeota archaeon]
MANYHSVLNEELCRALHVMNGTPKAAMMLIVGSSEKLSGSEIYDTLLCITESKKGIPHKAAFRSYGLETLVPYGFAISHRERYNLRTDITYFNPTKRGRTLGFGAAALALDFEAQTGLSLGKVLGASASREERKGPETRVRILTYLATVPKAHLKEIAQAAEIDPAIFNRHKKVLNAAGIITCKQQGRYVEASLTEQGKKVVEECIYPLLGATYSSTDLERLIETGHALQDVIIGKTLLRDAFASHSLKQPRNK